MDFADELARVRQRHVDLLDAFLEGQHRHLKQLAEWCSETLCLGGKLLLFGNGGSAAHAQHLAAEFVGRFEQSRDALPAMALTTDGAILSGIGNDDDFQRIFARQIEAFGKPGDLALGISTSGRSPNVSLGLRAARAGGLRTAALLGGDGGHTRDEVALAVVVPGTDTARIQEIQLIAGHVICRWVERALIHRPAPLREVAGRRDSGEAREARDPLSIAAERL